MNNDVFPNKFKAALAANRYSLVAGQHSLTRLALKFLVWLGLYWLVLDGEHAPNDISTFIPQLMALKAAPARQ